jgi:glycerophosphoryl diester phosphodiesterase
MKKIKIIAHRGYSKNYPENTRTAFEAAIKYGAQGLEFDIQKTSDNHFVIIHDDKIDRISKQSGKIKDFTLEELKKINIFGKKKILELEEFLKMIPGNIFLDAELKGETIDQSSCKSFLDIMLKYRNKSNLLISSFNYELLYFFKKQKIKIGLLTGGKLKKLGFIGILKALITLKPDYLCVPIKIAKYIGKNKFHIAIILLKFMGNKFIFWTVDHENELKLCRSYAEYIITNDVEKLKELLE